ncbi:phage integrase SAM-like domain-containing protein [Spirosoma sp. 48-14]|uniref:phage integrase SAM-like domain-containing protein n=1 Tax=Spirosoma sp. 48-14 TaxID=1895854 RepID=UPI0025E27A30|nr:phage integrase SAM-like domain-containing protein [Spirosoma sp. 48-14]
MYNINRMCVLFWFRKSTISNQVPTNKTTDDPKGFIQRRVTYNADRDELGSTHIECYKSQWDAVHQVFKGKSVWAQEQNKKLKSLEQRISKLVEDLEREHEEVTIPLIKNYFCNKKRIRGGQEVNTNRQVIYSLIDLCTAHYDHQQKRQKLKKITESTLEIQSNYAANIGDYLRSKKIDRLPASSLNHDFMEDLAIYLAESEGFAGSHIEKHLKFVKQTLKWATDRGKLVKNPLAGYKIESFEEEPDTTHLTIEELQRLIHFDFDTLAKSKKIHALTAETLEKERDAFVFNCFTGMHHCDYTSKRYHIELDHQGNYWLTGQRKKTNKPFFLKLLEPSVAILKKYDGLENLPVKSNQKRNDSLKLIAAFVNLPMNLSTKIARKTFADLALNEMLIPSDDVATMLGLTSTDRLKHYVRPRRNRIAKLLSSWEQLANPKQSKN